MPAVTLAPAVPMVPADGIAADRLHAAFGLAFADYLIGPFQVPLQQWPQFLARQGVDLALSRVALQGDAVVAFCLVAPRPECGSWRLGTMGALPAARGTGAAQALLQDFIQRAQEAGLAAVELECFAQNTRALRLYERHGFAVVDSLWGWELPAGAAVPQVAAEPAAVTLDAACDWLAGCIAAGLQLPLQVTATSLRAQPAGLQAWQRGTAQLVFSGAAPGPLVVHSLVDRLPAQQDAAALLAALLAAHPGRAVRVPQLQRQAVGGDALQQRGFERLELHQQWMRRPLAGTPA